MRKLNRSAAVILCLSVILSSCAHGDSSSQAVFESSSLQSGVTSSLDSSLPDESIQPDNENKEKDLNTVINETISSIRGRLPQDSSFEINAETVGEDIARLYDYTNQTGCYPVYKCAGAEYYSMGEYAFEQMLRELEKAQDFIFVEYFIIDEGEMWDKVYDVLKRKAAEGVEVRLIYDALATAPKLEDDFDDKLTEAGIKFYSYTGDHRKILVIDGRVVFTGGINISDEYINITHPYGVWKDNAIKIEGSAVKSFTLMFLQLWDSLDGEEDTGRYTNIDYSGEENDGYIMPYSDNPCDSSLVAKSFYISMLENAKDYLYLTTPYFLPDDEIDKAIKGAVERGVDVRVIVPGTSDYVTMDMMMKTHFRPLLDMGGRLYIYNKGFLHSKVFLCDDKKAIVGTVNIDNRSFIYDFECAAYFYDSSVIEQLKAEFDFDSDDYTEITYDNVDDYVGAGGYILKGLEGYF